MRMVSYSLAGATLPTVLKLAGLMLAGSLLVGGFTLPVIATAEEIVIDAVVATVDSKPITLQELGQALTPPRPLSFEEITGNTEALQTLDLLIRDRLVEAEAGARKISVTDEELNRYIAEVARRNDLTPLTFEQALRAEGRSLVEYKEKIKAEILRTKLVSLLMQGHIAVADEEVFSYVDHQKELFRSGERIKLRQIAVRADSRSPQNAKVRAEEALAHLKVGKPFEEVAARFSESPEAARGGDLGAVLLTDLAEPIRQSVAPLLPGEYTTVVSLGSAFHIFKVEARLPSDPKQDRELIEKVRAQIVEERLQERADRFFSQELFNKYSVDRKR